MRGPVLCGAAGAVMVGVAACGGSSDPSPSERPPPPVAIATCAATVIVPADTVRVVPSSSVPPTAVIRAGDALSLNVPGGSTLGFGAPVEPADHAALCRASGAPAGVAELIGRQPGFVRVVVAPASGRQLVVNVQVTV